MSTRSKAFTAGVLADEVAALERALRHAEVAARILDTLAAAHNGETGKGHYNDQYAVAADRAEALVNACKGMSS